MRTHSALLTLFSHLSLVILLRLMHLLNYLLIFLKKLRLRLMVVLPLISIKLLPLSNSNAHPPSTPSFHIYEHYVVTYACIRKNNTSIFDNFITKSNRNDYYLLQLYKRCIILSSQTKT